MMTKVEQVLREAGWEEGDEEAAETVPALRRNELIEGMVPRVAEHWYSELRIIKYVSPYVTTPPKWAEADDAIRESWKGEARDVLREAYEEATK